MHAHAWFPCPLLIGLPAAMHLLPPSAQLLLIRLPPMLCDFHCPSADLDPLRVTLHTSAEAAMVKVAGSLQRSNEVMRLVNESMRLPEMQRTLMEMSRGEWGSWGCSEDGSDGGVQG